MTIIENNLISCVKIGMVRVYHVDKKISDADMKQYVNRVVSPGMIHLILDEDADVYTQQGDLLLRFRKNILPRLHVRQFYDNVMPFAKTRGTSNRGSTTGSTHKNIKANPVVHSNIMGYFDRWSPQHKYLFRTQKKQRPVEVRETLFTAQYPEKFAKMVPLVEDVNKFYRRFIPDAYAKQIRKAKETHFRIGQTAFTTLTTNVNFQTMIHKDTGDDAEGFGNLVVIENGEYQGGETCFPQYGIGVNVRSGDVLFMDVHQWHGNLPLRNQEPGSIRLSLVCYLRTNIWKRTRNRSRQFFQRHNRTVRQLRQQHGE